jgi:hypothetical protein
MDCGFEDFLVFTKKMPKLEIVKSSRALIILNAVFTPALKKPHAKKGPCVPERLKVAVREATAK